MFQTIEYKHRFPLALDLQKNVTEFLQGGNLQQCGRSTKDFHCDFEPGPFEMFLCQGRVQQRDIHLADLFNGPQLSGLDVLRQPVQLTAEGALRLKCSRPPRTIMMRTASLSRD
jgi:hypothetical protein